MSSVMCSVIEATHGLSSMLTAVANLTGQKTVAARKCQFNPHNPERAPRKTCNTADRAYM